MTDPNARAGRQTRRIAQAVNLGRRRALTEHTAETLADVAQGEARGRGEPGWREHGAVSNATYRSYTRTERQLRNGR